MLTLGFVRYMKRTDTVVVIGSINSSQDGVIVSIMGCAPCLTSGHGNCPKVVYYEDKDTPSNKKKDILSAPSEVVLAAVSRRVSCEEGECREAGRYVLL